MYFEIEQQAVNSIKKAVKEFDYEIEEELKLEFPPNPELGDLASTICFAMAKKLRKSPNLVAEELVEKIEVPEVFKEVKPVGPYVNFFINYDNFSKTFLNTIDEKYGQLKKVNEKIVLEHTSANPNGPLHIGHIRNAIIGDSLTRLLKTAGRDVETQYYVNDMGRQIAMIVFGIEDLNLNIQNQAADKIDHKVGQLYFKVNEEVNENPELVSNVDTKIKAYEAGNDESLNELFEKVVNNCLTGVKETLARIHIKHDKFVWEGHFIRNGDVDKVVNELQDAGFLRENEVLYLDLIDFEIEKELVLRRSDGTSLYATRDLAYHKWKGTQGDVVLDVLGSDHKLAIEQLSKGLEIMHDKVPEVIFYEFITLPEGSMSTRKGVFISVDDLIDEAVKRAKDEIKSRRLDLSDDEIDKISEEIGIGAIRFYIAKLSPEKHITFKWDDALSFERGCASIQYAHARASKLLKKSEKNISKLVIDDAWKPNENEKDLIRVLTKFTQVIEDSANKKRVHLITQYCQDLANAFNKFYKSEQVIGSPLEDTRLVLVEKSKITLKNALNLLGVSAPDKM